MGLRKSDGVRVRAGGERGVSTGLGLPIVSCVGGEGCPDQAASVTVRDIAKTFTPLRYRVSIQ